MDKYYPGGDKKSTFPAYAYAVTSTVVEVLKRAGDNLTRENVMKQAASLKGVEIPLLLPGIKINTSATDFYPIQSVRWPASRAKPSSCSATSSPASARVRRSCQGCPPVPAGSPPFTNRPSGIPCPVGFLHFANGAAQRNDTAPRAAVHGQPRQRRART